MLRLRSVVSVHQFWRLPLACALVATLAWGNVAHAQEVSPDFAGQLQPTLPSNEQLLGQIQDTLSLDDLGVISDQANSSIDVGQQLLQQLTSALSSAPDDAARSRIEGVMTHAQAAVDSLAMIASATTVDVARGRLDQARGETQEGLDELKPYVLGLPSSGAIAGK